MTGDVFNRPFNEPCNDTVPTARNAGPAGWSLVSDCAQMCLRGCAPLMGLIW